MTGFPGKLGGLGRDKVGAVTERPCVAIEILCRDMTFVSQQWDFSVELKSVAIEVFLLR